MIETTLRQDKIAEYLLMLSIPVAVMLFILFSA